MKLKLVFASDVERDAFLLKTGERDIDNVHAGLINMAITAPGFVSGSIVGDGMDFLVFNGTEWLLEDVNNPFERILAGDIMEPADAPIKMLSVYSDTMKAWENRISNRYVPLVAKPYHAEMTAQREVEVVLIDSGVNHDHDEFNFADITDLYTVPFYTDTTDDIGHGTELASLIVGDKLGVNPSASIKVVKISSKARKPTLGELGLAIDAVYDYHIANPIGTRIVNMSWTIPYSAFITSRLKRLIDAGMMLVAAAGNTATNIDNNTPAGLSGVFTVAGSTADDLEFAEVYGAIKEIDMYAPAQDIGVADVADSTSYLVKSGSSYSAAIVSGVASILAGLNVTAPNVHDIKAHMQADATMNALIVNDLVPQEQNRLLHRPDSNSLPVDHAHYLISFPLNYTKPFQFDLRILIPSIVFDSDETPVFAIVFADDAAVYFGNSEVDANFMLNMVLTPGATLPEGIKVKKTYVTITATVAGVSVETAKCYLFVNSMDATYDDIRTELEDLQATTDLSFLEDVEDSVAKTKSGEIPV